MPSNATNAEVYFVYTGPGGDAVPRGVKHIRVDPSVRKIPDRAFFQRKKLTEVELCEGLVEIGEKSFEGCDHSITTINIPNSLRRINDDAFSGSLRCPVHLHDGIQSIGDCAFSGCIFTNFRVPSLITVIPHTMLINCTSLFSVEMPKNVTEIKYGAFFYCRSLRNVALPPNAIIGYNTLNEATDLLLLFGSVAEIIRELKHRFDGLLIHCAVYFQSYYQGELQRLIPSGNELDPTGNEQDCIGMTPLHILTCSYVHNLELYRLIVEKYPINLIIEDRWGATPLLYAFWGGAPAEIIQFLLQSYQSLYPGYVFNWTMIVETMGRCDTPKERIENLLCVQRMYFPEQSLNWEYLLNKFAEPSKYSLFGVPFCERMRFLFTYGMSDRVEALKFRLWRNHIKNMIHTANFAMRGGNSTTLQHNGDNRHILHQIRAKLDHFEDELPKLKDVTTILELALWKMNMSENGHQDRATQSQKKMKVDDSSIRSQNRVTCGADVVIGHVLPFLINTDGFFE
jgi:hypothetical protein